MGHLSDQRRRRQLSVLRHPIQGAPQRLLATATGSAGPGHTGHDPATGCASVVHGSTCGEIGGSDVGPLPELRVSAVPFKLNQDRRHHIPRQRHKVTNWPAYEASLRQRGSLTVWFSDDVIAAWAGERRATRGGQPWYSPLAILTALTAEGGIPSRSTPDGRPDRP